MTTGQEWLIDAYGCSPAKLRDGACLAGLFEALVVELALKVVGAPQWHVFPGEGGITGLALLSESHLSVHTFPEQGFAALNLYSCRRRARPNFLELATRHLGATRVEVRELSRGAAP